SIVINAPTATNPRVTVSTNLMVSCAYTLSATSATVGSVGGIGSVNIATAAGCPWTASSPVPWISISGGANGSGNGTIFYVVQSNSSGTARSASLSIGGLSLTIVQAPGCVFGLSPGGLSVGAGGVSGNITVGASDGICAWNVLNNAPFF